MQPSVLTTLRSEFLIEEGVVFLNHGSYGACPGPVFEEYQEWQRTLERNPVRFMERLRGLLAESRADLARYLNVADGDVVYFQNPTSAFNVVARSMASPECPLHLRPGDRVLSTDHEYGAMDRTWRLVCRQTGAQYVRQQIALPVSTHAGFVEQFWAGVTEQTRVIFLSHVTSPTALIFPVQEVCRRARAAGIISIVDGAHAPGQIPVDLQAIGADFYVAACHKWMCAPKGAAFLYARPEMQPLLQPLVVSFGWNDEAPGQGKFVAYNEYQGTRDPAAFLSVPAAIRFMAEHDWPAQRERCRDLARTTRRRINELTGLDSICPEGDEWLGQFVAVRLPGVDVAALARRLSDEHNIIVPVLRWNNESLMRISFQAYNDGSDAGALIAALARLLPEIA